MKRAVTSSSGVPRNAVPPAAKPLDWAQSAGQVEPVMRAIEKHVRRKRNWRVAAGIGAMALVVAGGVAMRFPSNSPLAPDATSGSTIVLQPQRQFLSDGSVVELRPGAAIVENFQARVRRVILQKGEAHFQVTKDPARPFIVEASGIGVRAVGTAFSVQISNGEIDVIVTEGVVAVAATAASSPTARVEAGNRIVVDVQSTLQSTMQPVAISEGEMQDRLAWRVPRLEFSGTPLAEVVALFNRYSNGRDGGRLVLADPDLGKLPLSGVLRADNVNVLLNILGSSYGLAAKPTGGGEIVLHRPDGR